jgi:purine-binding chemotaxis protein CheW
MADAPRGHLVFVCGTTLYAVPSETAAEVVNVPTLTRVPGSPVHVLGVFAHRGEVLPVIDLAQLTGLKRDPAALKRAVVVRVAQGAVALTASRVNGVATLTGTFDRLGSSGVQSHLRGPATSPDGSVAVIDPEGLVEFLSHAESRAG